MRRNRSGFTLIELMVVVAIMGIIAGLLVPALTSARERAERAAQEAPRQREPAPSALRPPAIESAQLALEVNVSSHRLGLEVSNRYRARCEGKLTIRPPAPAVEGEPASALWLPLPSGTIEASDVRLQVREGDRWIEPVGVRYRFDGILWSPLPEPSAEPLELRVSYLASGRDRFELLLPPAAPLRELDLTVTLPASSRSAVPDRALQPTDERAQGDVLQRRWQLRQLVSQRPVVVTFPGDTSPLGRVSQLFRLLGVGVLLFGIGLWYQSELDRPGLLEHVRFGAFLLLAINYSLFFGVLAVLAFKGDLSTPAAMGISALVSWPLLALHASRIVDWRFALTRVMPLTIATQAAVAVVVYGGSAREYVFLGAGALAVAYLTLTFRRFAAQLEAHAAERAEAQQAAQAELSASLETVAARQQLALQQLTGPRSEAATARRGQLAALERELDSLRIHVRYLGENDPDSARQQIRTLAEQVDALAAATPAARADGDPHCVRCGAPGCRGRFCAHCGGAAASAVECGCGAHLWLTDEARRHCPACGSLLTTGPDDDDDD